MKYFLMIFSLVLPMLALAEPDTVYEPANFTESQKSLQNLVKFPKSIAESDTDTTVPIRCDAYISDTGKFISNFCNDEGRDVFLYLKAINNAAENAKIKPGKINGRGRNVWFQYFLVFSKVGKKTLVEGFPNSGIQLKQFGPDYTSAQRYREDTGGFGSGCGKAYSQIILVKAIIGKNGKAKKVEVEGKDTTDTCKNNLIADFMEQEFIPAFVDGVPVDSYYSEDIFTRYRSN